MCSLKPLIFVDMDGVLADFDQHYKATFGVCPDKAVDNVEWAKVRGSKDFYLNIPPMADMPELMAFLQEHYAPVVLTGIPKSVPEAAANKSAWVNKHLPGIEVICCLSKNKSLYCQPGNIIIDDWPRYRDLWTAKGGRWINHVSAAETIKQLTADLVGCLA